MNPITVCLVFFFGLLLGVGATVFAFNRIVAQPRFWKGVIRELRGTMLEYVAAELCSKLAEMGYYRSLEDLRDLSGKIGLQLKERP